MVDQGSAYKSKEMSENLDASDVLLKDVPMETSGPNGLCSCTITHMEPRTRR